MSGAGLLVTDMLQYIIPPTKAVYKNGNKRVQHHEASMDVS